MTTVRDRYRVVKRLGQGGGGSVFAVADLLAQGSRQVALKALFAGRDDRALLELLRQEFRVLATLRHPSIARVYDFGRLPAGSSLEGAASRPGYFFTRELIEGDDLGRYCEGRSAAAICQVFQKTADALDALHRSGMVHRDFKPANVIISEGGRPHLIDFGLVEGEGVSTQASGTAPYFAPEMLRGEAVDRRADLYALGISLYQLLVGELPLPGASLPELINWHLSGPPLSIGDKIEMPSMLDRLIRRLTDRDPQQRYPSAHEASAALSEVIVAMGAEPSSGQRTFLPPAPGEALSAPLLELEELVRRRVQLAQDEPSLLAIVAAPGAGKSTILRELAWRFQLEGVEVLRGEFQAGDLRPYGLLGDLIAQVASLTGLKSPLAGGVLEHRDDQDQDTRYGLYQRLTDFIAEAAAKMPLLLLLDDVQQADDESRAALRYMGHALEQGDRAMLVLAYLDDDAVDAALGEPTRLELRASLSVDDTSRMLADASARPDPALGALIHQHTGGNPMFVMEVLRKLHDAGWPPSIDLDQLKLPRGLEEVYARRWDELGPAEHATLVALAVLGRPSSGAELLGLVDAARADLEFVGLPLEHLEATGWIGRQPDGGWAFRQGPAAHFVYDATSDEHRRRYHLAAARFANAEDCVACTRHALAGGDIDLAQLHLDAALSQLRALGANRRAIELAQQAVELLETGPEATALRRELARLYSAVGDYERAASALSLVCQQSEGEALLEAQLALARVHCLGGDADPALEIAERLLAEQKSPRHRLAAATARVWALAIRDDHEAVLSAAKRALDIEAELQKRKQPQPATRAELRSRMGWALGALSRFEDAVAALTLGLQDARDAEDYRAVGNILNRWAGITQRQGGSAVAERYREALDCALMIGDVGRAAAIRANLASFHLQRGEYAASLDHLRQSLRLFEAMGYEEAAVPTRFNLGMTEYKLGLYEQARLTLERTLAQYRRLGSRAGEASSLLLAALVAGHRGDLAAARAGIEQARALSFELGQRRDAVDAQLDLVELELLAGDVAAGQEAVEQAESEFDLTQLPELWVRKSALSARIAARRGDDAARQRAAAKLADALNRARSLDSAELIWQCHAAAVELADASGQPSRAANHAVAGLELLKRMAEGLPAEIQAAFWQEPWRAAIKRRASAHDFTERKTEMTSEATQPPEAMLDATLLASSISDSGTTRSVQERFYRLLEIYRRINSELDPERLLGLVMDTAVELTGAERGFLLIGKSPATLEVKIARNLDPEGKEGAYSRSIAERVAASGEPVITVSAQNDPRFVQYASVHQMRLESVLCIPIQAQDAISGVLYMESRFQSGRFTPEDQRLLMAFGDQVAIALTNAQLLTDNMRKARELERAKREIEVLAEERGRLLERRTEQLAQAERSLAETRARLESQAGRFGMVGCSPQMARVFEMIERVAAADIPVLIEGESGTGKEMVARAIHENSPRKRRRLVSVNCAAIPENLLESELFGHVRGAFTGADRERKGLFSAADGGTLFLDEIGDMPMRMQVDLLRALQEKTIRPVGGQKDIQVDVRVIGASNKSLARLVQEGSFREDLFYRLHVVRVELPPLRDRQNDVPLLVDHFLARIAERMHTEKPGITKTALRRLMAYDWPGNVRQLEHALMNAMVLAEGDVLSESDLTLESPLELTPRVKAPADRARAAFPRSDEDRHAAEKKRILEALEGCNWNKSEAARAIGMPRRTFYRRLRAYGIS